LNGALAELEAARLRPICAWWWRMGSDWEMRPRVMANGILYIPIDRVVEVTVGDAQARIAPGRLAVMPAGIAQAARYAGRPPRRFDLLCLHLTCDDAHGLDLLRRLPCRFFDVPGWPGSLPQLRRLAELLHAGGADGVAMAGIGLRGLLADLVIEAGGLAVQAEPDPRIASCLARISADPAGRLSIGELACEAGVSPRRLRDLFRSATGVAPKDFQIRTRIAEATRLLTDPTQRVKDVAQRLGFASDHEFHACFRRVLGLTPTAWRHGSSGA